MPVLRDGGAYVCNIACEIFTPVGVSASPGTDVRRGGRGKRGGGGVGGEGGRRGGGEEGGEGRGVSRLCEDGGREHCVKQMLSLA
jgi:hypothetical protein